MTAKPAVYCQENKKIMGKNKKNRQGGRHGKRLSNFGNNRRGGRRGGRQGPRSFNENPNIAYRGKNPVQSWLNRQIMANKQESLNKLSLREDQVGITEFVSEGGGFTGVVKSRFSDFHVNEIDNNGSILQLDDLSIPKPSEENLDKGELDKAQKELTGIITPELWIKIGALAEMKANDKAAQPIEINITSLDKEMRTKMHSVIKALCGHKVDSTTISRKVASKEERFVKIMKPSGKPNEVRNRWPYPGEYVHFLVFKQNSETTEVASKIASFLRMHPSQVNYCGTKDKRAKTTQKFCIKRRDPNLIREAAQVARVWVGNFEFSNEVLKLGDLKGNRFRIALRLVDGDQNEIENCLINLRDKGFINYYGLQRFGNHCEIPTYEIGVALIKADYKKVAELILKPREFDKGFMDKIRKHWWENRDSAAAAAMFSKNDLIESKLLNGLAEYGENDYSAALRKIPRNMLLLYPHSFQSFVFNRVASKRIKKFGLQLIPGDLVYRSKEEMDEDIAAKLESIAEDEEGEIDKTEECEGAVEDKEPTLNKTKETDASNINIEGASQSEKKNDARPSYYKRKVKALTEEDIASGEYTVYDVVLPLPGYDITYPDNEVGSWYEEILQEYDLSSESLRHKVKSYALPGSYRKLLIVPRDFSWKFRSYSSKEENLIASDWDYITGKYLEIENHKPDGKLRALVLNFSLPTSAYATMLLRELLKSDTSPANQMEIENKERTKIKENTDQENSKNRENNETAEKRKGNDDNGLVEVEEKKFKENDEDDVKDVQDDEDVKDVEPEGN